MFLDPVACERKEVFVKDGSMSGWHGHQTTPAKVGPRKYQRLFDLCVPSAAESGEIEVSLRLVVLAMNIAGDEDGSSRILSLRRGSLSLVSFPCKRAFRSLTYEFH
ncbi:hypothetical protein AVEN_199144-1 [Araneus ventricosus]|uniref:Uncharacterized protein n=1 Tax=Araneus ventricosus TaxID=182803 RepID=A0A4Y2WXH2_ARAVE|nr:hypothetical protein AVEN_82982-1 [Araneus ventricosus]GBO41334.1 hypothetical protein AVEN_199144-1 [Araneus ventricosus]